MSLFTLIEVGISLGSMTNETKEGSIFGRVMERERRIDGDN